MSLFIEILRCLKIEISEGFHFKIVLFVRSSVLKATVDMTITYIGRIIIISTNVKEIH